MTINNRRMLIVALLAVFAIGAGVYAYITFFRAPSMLQELNEAIGSGNYQRSVDAYEAIVASSEVTATEKADATIWSSKAAFKLSADINDRLESVRRNKEVFLNESVDLPSRIVALNALASSFCGSGRNPLIFQEIYTGEPFNEYLEPGDPN